MDGSYTKEMHFFPLTDEIKFILEKLHRIKILGVQFARLQVIRIPSSAFLSNDICRPDVRRSIFAVVNFPNMRHTDKRDVMVCAIEFKIV